MAMEFFNTLEGDPNRPDFDLHLLPADIQELMKDQVRAEYEMEKAHRAEEARKQKEARRLAGQTNMQITLEWLRKELSALPRLLCDGGDDGSKDEVGNGLNGSNGIKENGERESSGGDKGKGKVVVRHSEGDGEDVSTSDSSRREVDEDFTTGESTATWPTSSSSEETDSVVSVVQTGDPRERPTTIRVRELTRPSCRNSASLHDGRRSTGYLERLNETEEEAREELIRPRHITVREVDVEAQDSDDREPRAPGQGLPETSGNQNEKQEGDEIPQNMFSLGGRTYRTMGRQDTIWVLITNQVGLGILSLPSTLHTLGILPGVIANIGFGLLSTYTAYELLQFYNKHPHVVNVVDMAKVVGGRAFEIFVGICVMIKLCLTCSSAIVTLSVALNTISNHGLCTAGWIGLSALVCFALCIPRKFRFVAKLGIPSTISILGAVLIVMISLGVWDPKSAPEGFQKEIRVVGEPTFREGLHACLQICYAYAGNIAFITYMAEMKNPKKDFFFSLVVLQSFSILLYLVVSFTIYFLAGQYTTSPSLGSAPELAAKLAYGVVIPAVLGTGLVFGHAAIKLMYVAIMRALKATDQATDNSRLSWGMWIGSGGLFWVMAFIIANAIPIFESILAICAATFIAWFTFGISAVFWLHLNWGKFLSTRWKALLTILNVFIICLAVFMNVAGLWAASTALMDKFRDESCKIHGAFTCADNSLL